MILLGLSQGWSPEEEVRRVFPFTSVVSPETRVPHYRRQGVPRDAGGSVRKTGGWSEWTDRTVKFYRYITVQRSLEELGTSVIVNEEKGLFCRPEVRVYDRYQKIFRLTNEILSL